MEQGRLNSKFTHGSNPKPVDIKKPPWIGRGAADP